MWSYEHPLIQCIFAHIVKATALMCDLHNLVVGELPE